MNMELRNVSTLASIASVFISLVAVLIASISPYMIYIARHNLIATIASDIFNSELPDKSTWYGTTIPFNVAIMNRGNRTEAITALRLTITPGASTGSPEPFIVGPGEARIIALSLLSNDFHNLRQLNSESEAQLALTINYINAESRETSKTLEFARISPSRDDKKAITVIRTAHNPVFRIIP
jgi:hypothetical protein